MFSVSVKPAHVGKLVLKNKLPVETDSPPNRVWREIHDGGSKVSVRAWPSEKSVVGYRAGGSMRDATGGLGRQVDNWRTRMKDSHYLRR